MDENSGDLGDRIEAARAKHDQDTGADQKETPSSDIGKAMRAGVDLVAGLLVGGFLGYWIDQWLGTIPLFMIVLLFFGFAAGILNIYRSQMGQDYKVGFKNGNEGKKED